VFAAASATAAATTTVRAAASATATAATTVRAAASAAASAGIASARVRRTSARGAAAGRVVSGSAARRTRPWRSRAVVLRRGIEVSRLFGRSRGWAAVTRPVGHRLAVLRHPLITRLRLVSPCIRRRVREDLP
jgi:transposase